MATDSFAKKTAIIVAMNRITGVRPLHHSNTWFWLSLSFLYKLVLITALTCTMYYNNRMKNNKIMANSTIWVMYMFMVIFSGACALTVQLLGWIYSKEMLQLRKNIAETDRNLMKLNVVVDYRTLSFLIIVVCVSCVFNAAGYFFLYLYQAYSYRVNMRFFLNDVIYSALHNITGMVLLDFAAHVCWLRERFKQTNDLLKKFFIEECQIETEAWNNKTVSSWLERCMNEWHIERISRRNKINPYNGTQIMKRQLYSANKISMLQQIRYVHLQLCVITKSLKKIFSMQLMCLSSLTTLNFVEILYFCYTEWTSKQRYVASAFLLTYIFDAFYLWLKVVAVCLLCENTDKETKRAAQILQVCSIHNSDFQLQHECSVVLALIIMFQLIQFSTQISFSDLDNRKPRLFPLNYTYIVQSIGTVFTYFLVTIQWNQGLNVTSSFSSNSTLTNPSSYNATILADQLIENQTFV